MNPFERGLGGRNSWPVKKSSIICQLFPCLLLQKMVEIGSLIVESWSIIDPTWTCLPRRIHIALDGVY